VNVPCIRAGGCTERCNPSTLSVGCSKTREPTRVTTRTPAVGYNPGWVDPPVTALMPVSQYGRPPLAFRQLGSHCRRQCRQVESLCRHGTASAESLPARHGRAPIPFFLPAMPAISPHGNLPSAGTHPWLARWLGCFIKTGDVPLHMHDSGEHTRLASVLRFTARAARCFSFSTRRSYCELQRARA
jgi:hypothetical protein